MKNLCYFLLGFSVVAGIMMILAAPSFALDFDTSDLETEQDKKVVGVFLNSYTGTKSALCLNDIVNCLIEYLPGSQVTGDTLTLYKLKDPVSKYRNGQINPDFLKLYKSSEIIFGR